MIYPSKNGFRIKNGSIVLSEKIERVQCVNAKGNVPGQLCSGFQMIILSNLTIWSPVK